MIHFIPTRNARFLKEVKHHSMEELMSSIAKSSRRIDCKYVHLSLTLHLACNEGIDKSQNIHFQFIWKEKVEALNSLKIVGNIELDERPNDEVISNSTSYFLEETFS